MKTKRMTTLHLRKSTNSSRFRRGFFFIALTWFALSPTARAVDPPPDGGYPNQNTAEGDGALFSLTLGGDNTAIGFHALYYNTNSQNTAVGNMALQNNTSGSQNTAVGAGALTSNNGYDNTAIGVGALTHDTSGNENTAIGAQALAFPNG